MSINIKSPSENNPFVPPLLYFLSWLLTNLFILFGMGSGGIFALIGQGFITSAILVVFQFFMLVVLIAFLYRKKFTDFFISLVLIVIMAFTTGFIDRLLEPYKVKKIVGNIEAVVMEASLSRSFGNETPVNICESKNGESENYNCKACYCPYSMELTEVKGVPHCFFAAQNGQLTSDKFEAPCSSIRSLDKYSREVKNLFDMDITKNFALYQYRNNQLESCKEFRVWDNWDTSIMKKVCEHNTGLACIVQEQKNCSTLNAKIICQKKNTNTHRALKMVSYIGSYNTSGFEKDECKINY